MTHLWRVLHGGEGQKEKQRAFFSGVNHSCVNSRMEQRYAIFTYIMPDNKVLNLLNLHV